jgi:hypothetical protein
VIRKLLLAALTLLSVPVTAQVTAVGEPADPASWSALPADKSFVLSWGSRDVHYAQSAVPRINITAEQTLTAWRGETVSALALLVSRQGTRPLRLAMRTEDGGEPRADSVATARFVRYVLCDGKRGCGTNTMNTPAYLVPDIIDMDTTWALAPMTTRPVWVSVTVPRDAKAGKQTLWLTVADAQTKQEQGRLRLTLNVVDRTLPRPADYQFHVDFWQQPYSVARYAGVRRWSQHHFDLLRPYLRLLARSGQKVATTVLFYEPWGEQSNDKFDAMVRTTRRKNGKWHYDYSVFDHYVALCDSCGINRQINCYSMIPWDMTFNYYDEALRREVSFHASTADSAYRALWVPFLKSFARHLKKKGWFDKTCIAMDERGLDDMKRAYALLQEAVPDFRMALAGNLHDELADKLADYSLAFPTHFSDAQRAARSSKGMVSTTYTCCTELTPNLETYNDPADAAYLPLYCRANGFDGYLHWSWMNWTDRPLVDSRFKFFPAGDTYLVYPGPRSSVRWERFIEGVQQVEKYLLLRAERQAEDDRESVRRLDDALRAFQSGELNYHNTSARLVNAFERLLNEMSTD